LSSSHKFAILIGKYTKNLFRTEYLLNKELQKMQNSGVVVEKKWFMM